MTESNRPAAVPAWHTRLLDRIQNLAADRARILRQGYRMSDGDTDAVVLAWRTQLQLLATSREEIVTQALAVGISQIDVGDALLLGHQGFRAPVDTAGTAEPGDRVREMMTDSVVNDTWQLQHMAAIHVVRDHHLLTDAHYFQDPQIPAQFERNMAALWMRATAVAQAISLSAEEAAGMWATDTRGWHQVLAASVDRYDPGGVEERWRAFAWQGIAERVHRDLAVLRMDPSHTEVLAPIPNPHTMFEQVTQALRVGVDDSAAGVMDPTVDAALSADTDLRWEPLPASDANAGPTATNSPPGAEI
ncbi:hypothetical protein [Nocardia sp. NPDC056100]|uniref:hypothetical protein n=1 Tax=Nocardia sp. NPDC056100 TaxID=3345712 RepID=UPI0035DD3F41